MEHQERQERQGRQEVSAEIDGLVRTIIDAGLKVHRALGPGLLESAYEKCLVHELRLRGIGVRQQVPLTLTYEGLVVDMSYRLDIVANEAVLVEVKSVEALTRLHQAQVLTYLRLSKLRLGLLMNFNVELLKHGVRRLVLSS